MMLIMSSPDRGDIDYRFSLANERTFLAWIRTSLALIAGGIASAKALHFHHEVWRWAIAGPATIGGALLAADATIRWRTYEAAMRAGKRLPIGRGLRLVGIVLSAYAILALIVSAIDG
jgi:putative membrane protein